MKSKKQSSPVEFLSMYDSLTDRAVTRGQSVLRKKHGTPKEFARACADAVGEISVAEAHTAVEKYVKEYEAA